MRFLPALAVALLAGQAAAHGGHDHAAPPPQEIDAAKAPTITSLHVTKDPSGGFTITVETANFTFLAEEPETAIGQSQDGATGHAHVFINGHKLAEMHTPVLHLAELPFGPHDIKVVLTNADHADYAILGRVIAAEVEFTVE